MQPKPLKEKFNLQDPNQLANLGDTIKFCAQQSLEVLKAHKMLPISCYLQDIFDPYSLLNPSTNTSAPFRVIASKFYTREGLPFYQHCRFVHKAYLSRTPGVNQETQICFAGGFSTINMQLSGCIKLADHLLTLHPNQANPMELVIHHKPIAQRQISQRGIEILLAELDVNS